MPSCSDCGQRVAANASKCPHCGSLSPTGLVGVARVLAAGLVVGAIALVLTTFGVV